MSDDQVAGTIQPEKEGRQASLFPRKPKPPKPIRTDEWLAVEDLPTTEGVQPSDLFVENVRQHGIFFPIMLRERKRGGPQLIDGRRRLETARRLGIEDIRCDTYPVSARVLALLSLAANYQRDINPQAELLAIERLLKRAGVTAQLINEQLGIPVQVIERRLKLKALVPELRKAFDAYLISVGIAEAASQLETARQMDLVEILQDVGALTMKDVRGLAKQADEKEKDSQTTMPDLGADKGDVIKVEREDVEKAAEVLAYAANMLKEIHKGGGAKAAEVVGIAPMVQELEDLARTMRVYAG